MRHSFSIYFYLKRRKLQKDSKSTIMLRIIVNNKAADVSLKTSILHEHWDKQNRRVSDMNPEAHDINTYLNKVSSTLQHHYRQAQMEGKHLTASMLKQRFMATGSNPPSLLEIFDKQVKMRTGWHMPDKSACPIPTDINWSTGGLKSSARKWADKICH